MPEGKQPHLLVDGVSRDDIKQGGLGDCWFLSSCAAVSQQERFMRKVSLDVHIVRSSGFYLKYLW